MITAEERQKLEALRTQVACDKQFVCVGAALSDLCCGVYHSDLDILECQEESSPTCKFARPFGCTAICLCPMRKFIAQNFDKWSAEDTATLRIGQAEQRYKQALALREKSVGPNHPDTAASLNSLAQLYTAQGQFDQAEPFYQRVLAILEKSFGADHPDTALALENYGAMLQAAQRPAQAEPLLRRAAKIRAARQP